MKSNRRAIVPISEQLIEAMVGLPKGYEIHGMQINNQTFSIDLLVTSPDLDEVPDGTMPPRVWPTIVVLRKGRFQDSMSFVWRSDPAPIYDEVARDLPGL